MYLVITKLRIRLQLAHFVEEQCEERAHLLGLSVVRVSWQDVRAQLLGMSEPMQNRAPSNEYGEKESINSFCFSVHSVDEERVQVINVSFFVDFVYQYHTRQSKSLR